jgi:hypothetical protein
VCGCRCLQLHLSAPRVAGRAYHSCARQVPV